MEGRVNPYREERERQRRRFPLLVAAGFVSLAMFGWVVAMSGGVVERVVFFAFAAIEAGCLGVLWELRKHGRTLDLLDDVMREWKRANESLRGRGE
jgi:hypothetical protein